MSTHERDRIHGTEIERLEAELLRLCGPTCPHDGKRAIEHEIPLTGWEYQTGAVIKLDGEDHARWPDGIAWLKKRRKQRGE